MSTKKHIEKQEGSIDVISVDLSQSRTGKLSEFFEPEINYIWLEDELEEAQLNSNLQQIIFHGDKFMPLIITVASAFQCSVSLGNI